MRPTPIVPSDLGELAFSTPHVFGRSHLGEEEEGDYGENRRTKHEDHQTAVSSPGEASESGLTEFHSGPGECGCAEEGNQAPRSGEQKLARAYCGSQRQPASTGSVF
jgi:hypothetical protein